MNWYCYLQQAEMNKTIVHELGIVKADTFDEAMAKCRVLTNVTQIAGETGSYSFCHVVRRTPLEVGGYARRQEIVGGIDAIASKGKRKAQERAKSDVYIPQKDGMWTDGLALKKKEI